MAGLQLSIGAKFRYCLWVRDTEPDPLMLPNQESFQTPKLARYHFILAVNANYQLKLIVGNLLDVIYVGFRHSQLSLLGWVAGNISKVSLDGDVIPVLNVSEDDNILPNMSVLKLERDDIGKTVMVEIWLAPSVLTISLTFTCESGEINLAGCHFFTPETEISTHYFVTDDQTISPEMTAQVSGSGQHVFSTEDVPLLEAQQLNFDGRDIDEFKIVSMRMDLGPIGARKYLAKLIRNEQAAMENSD